MYLDMDLRAGVDGWAMGPDAYLLARAHGRHAAAAAHTGRLTSARASESSSCHVVHERVEVSLLSSPKCTRSKQPSVAEASGGADGTTSLLRARLAPAMGPSRCSGSDSDSQASGIMMVYYPACRRGCGYYTLFSTKNRSLRYCPRISLSIRAPQAVVGQYANGAVPTHAVARTSR
ncbi:hypothetical protein COCC4DRAFT_145726 [Bipolaris maydis ATCC 48331]|uniref:Uncharacterized protein n=2 Tax=Cochliobolus heterostrophus TaxID=5016 RepID=M2UJP6_COCH5|nr:uncharacterized protein COCC4DRAFT_145726 [Bipolaris maydis ATCC 48331]EMD88177.1 hypothetical protein COCHEDRAFT_1159362 [Bipolaris maydis C5]ENI02244.1 hypothetical protein COCC4DRAFT_145726 [Bipolaris maydis ATCC 48331]